MYIQRNKAINSKTGKVYTSVLLCSKYREGKKVKTRITLRPVYHHNENQTRGHVLLCMLAYAIIK